MNFQLVQKAIINGWCTEEEDFDSLDFDIDFLRYLNFNDFTKDDLYDLYEEFDEGEFHSYLKSNMSKNELIDFLEQFVEFGEIDFEELFKLVEDKYEINLEIVSNIDQEREQGNT